MKSKHIMVRMDEELKQKIEKEANKKGLNTSAWIRMVAIEKMMKGDE